MGILSTYGELKEAISTYTGRGGNAQFLASVPLFVRRAHDTMMRELRIPLLQATADLSIDGERVAQPSDFRAVARLWIDGSYDTPINPAPVDQRSRLAVQYGGGRPAVYALEGSYFAFAPIPDATYTGRLLYYRHITFFASDSATNDLLARYPQAYLYGALAEAARFDKNDEDEARYEALFRSEIDQINRAEMLDAMSGGSLMPMPSVGPALVGGIGQSGAPALENGPDVNFTETLQSGLNY